MELPQPKDPAAREMPGIAEPDWLKPLLDAEAPLAPVAHVPELLLPVCLNLTRIWEAAESALGKELEHAPFWATAWPGGIALARWILDNRSRFRSRPTLDLGCGSGIAGIAAARAGARTVLNEIDPLALDVARIAARANRVSVDFVLEDLQPPDLEMFDLILVGDGFYERPRAAHLLHTLEHCVARGTTVVAADAGRNIIALPGRCVLELEVPVSPDIEARTTRMASVHLLEP